MIQKTKNDVMSDIERIVGEVLADSEITKEAEENIRKNYIITEKDRGIVFTL